MTASESPKRTPPESICDLGLDGVQLRPIMLGKEKHSAKHLVHHHAEAVQANSRHDAA